MTAIIKLSVIWKDRNITKDTQTKNLSIIKAISKSVISSTVMDNEKDW